MIEEEINARLRGSAELVAALGGTAKVYPVKAKQGVAEPWVVYSKIDGIPVQSLAGSNALRSGRFQIDSYAKEYGQAKGIARLVERALGSGWQSASLGQVSVLLDSDGDLYEADTARHRVRQDFALWWDEV